MLTTLEVLLCSLLVVLLPVVACSLITGSPPPEKGWLAKYYRAERYLNVARDLVLLAICAIAIARLGRYLGHIDPTTSGTVDLAMGLLFGAAFIGFLSLWIKAALKVRNLDKHAT